MDLTRRVRHGAALAVLAAAAAAAEESGGDAGVSVWDGVYTAVQAERGEAVYAEPCGRCHGWRLDGAPDDPDMLPTPPVAGAKFLRNWSGRSLAALLELTRTTMPANNPGYLTDRELADVLAYMLAASGIPAGERELVPDPGALAVVLIEPGRP